MVGWDMKTRSSLGFALLALTVLGLVSMPAMAVRAALVSARAGAFSESVKAVLAHQDNGLDPQAVKGRDVPKDINRLFMVVQPPKIPELYGIWGSSCLFSDGKGGVVVCEPGDRVGTFTVGTVDGLSVVLMSDNGERKVNITPYKPPKGWKPKGKSAMPGKTAPPQTSRPSAPRPAPKAGAMTAEMRKKLVQAMRKRMQSRANNRSSTNRKRR